MIKVYGYANFSFQQFGPSTKESLRWIWFFKCSEIDLIKERLWFREKKWALLTCWS